MSTDADAAARRPGRRPTASSAGPGPDPGTHDYAVTFVTATGETTPGPIGGQITTARTPMPPPDERADADRPTSGGAVDAGAIGTR